MLEFNNAFSATWSLLLTEAIVFLLAENGWKRTRLHPTSRQKVVNGKEYHSMKQKTKNKKPPKQNKIKQNKTEREREKRGRGGGLNSNTLMNFASMELHNNLALA